jgi:oligopeptide/dipeptide ABC transporter ATP-binding protein
MSAMIAPLVRVRGLVKEFHIAGAQARSRVVRAVAGVDLDIMPGEVMAIVGESGSGKTTVARCILRLLEPTAGTIEFEGADIARARGATLHDLRRQMQLVFQDPIGSLDPRMSVRDQVAEPLRTHLDLAGSEVDAQVLDLLQDVGLARLHLPRRPHELSGGQCQRVAIARALALRPRLVILDEPTSALDVSVQAQILNLLMELRRSHGLTYLFISHDLGVVRHVSDRIAVMYLGRLVEQGPAEEIFAAPRHPYTQALLAARPAVDEEAEHPALIKGDPPSAADPPAGCRFHPRCWLRDRLGGPIECETIEPPAPRLVADHEAACHFAHLTLSHLEKGPPT